MPLNFQQAQHLVQAHILLQIKLRDTQNPS